MKKKSRHQQYIVQQLRNNQQKQQLQQGLNPGLQGGSATNSVMGHPVQQQQIQTPVGFEPMPTQQQSAYPQHHFEPPQHFQPPPPRRHIYVHEPCN